MQQNEEALHTAHSPTEGDRPQLRMFPKEPSTARFCFLGFLCHFAIRREVGFYYFIFLKKWHSNIGFHQFPLTSVAQAMLPVHSPAGTSLPLPPWLGEGLEHKTIRLESRPGRLFSKPGLHPKTHKAMLKELHCAPSSLRGFSRTPVSGVRAEGPLRRCSQTSVQTSHLKSNARLRNQRTA